MKKIEVGYNELLGLSVEEYENLTDGEIQKKRDEMIKN